MNEFLAFVNSDLHQHSNISRVSFPESELLSISDLECLDAQLNEGRYYNVHEGQ